MPRGGGKGGTLLRACSFKLRTFSRHFIAMYQYSFKIKSGDFFCHNTHDKGPPAETGRCTKRRVREAVP